jgi:hypothetical protein
MGADNHTKVHIKVKKLKKKDNENNIDSKIKEHGINESRPALNESKPDNYCVNKASEDF